MATKLHHAVVKRATRLGVEVTVTDDGVRLIKDRALSIESFDTPKEALDEFEAGHVDFEKTPKGNLCGVMVRAYHDRYEHNGHGPGSCDGLDCALRDAYTLPTGVDVEGLKKLGEELGLWNDAWDALNPGMKRMNLSNRVRAWLRNNADAAVTLGDTTGRFGVPYKPATSKRSMRKAA